MPEKAHLFGLEGQGDELFSRQRSMERDQIIGRGVMRLHGKDEQQIIPITHANQIFFFNRPGSDIPELSYQGSGLVASLLEGQREFEIDRTVDELQPLSLFDIEGDFYDQYVLTDFVEEMKHSDGVTKKHHATFQQVALNGNNTLELEIDQIRCISTAIDY